MAGRLAGKLCFVTAAGQGIGRATALAFAAEGGTVIATDRDAGKLAGLAAHGIETHALDVLDDAAVEAAIAAAGMLDVLFNCAGIVHQNTALTCTEAEWDLAFALNVRAMWRTMRAVLPGMLERGRGSVINMASAAGSIKGAPNRFVYGTTKAAVIGMTKAVAADTVARGVRCNCLCPGTIDTPSLGERVAANAAAAGSVEAARGAFVARQAMGRLGTAEEIASLAVYLAADESAFVTGQAMVIDGGWTL
ncbi:SDR family oxidoreductase [Roseomonas sp. NAR14]|uniref:SDR family oxidoreductase n=1 Tax=Roseomonas acroporae TaxID=2937791 RepID=A0A9X1Y708_9PROT|nr:SDR family oxidoreductase [Roseomonas acroporae]MCK8785154.1 SDR family oxidoreductase [Roseomonas acroporae]